MRKQELIHLHALCVALRSHLEDRREGSPDPFHSYDDCGVSPAAIHRRKEAHREAVFRLLDGLETLAEDDSSTLERPRSRS